MARLLNNEHVKFIDGYLAGYEAPVVVMDGTYKKYALVGDILEDDNSVISLNLLQRLGVKIETAYPEK